MDKIACFFCNIDPEGRIWEVVFVTLLILTIGYLR